MYCKTGIGTLLEDEDDIKRESFFKRFREDELDGLVNKLICPVAAENPIISKRNCLYKIWHKISFIISLLQRPRLLVDAGTGVGFWIPIVK